MRWALSASAVYPRVAGKRRATAVRRTAVRHAKVRAPSIPWRRRSWKALRPRACFPSRKKGSMS
jgi:hypothetical protein